jgi:RNA polymerase sigma factor (sigma-70 family)
MGSYVAPRIDDVERDWSTIEEIYRTESSRLWRAVYMALGSREVANDAVSEAFAQLMVRGSSVRNPKAWVWTTAFRIGKGLLSDGHAQLQEAEAEANLPEPMLDLWLALGSLTRHQRAAVVLADFAGYRHSEIARMLGSTPAAVAVHVHRARAKLRDLLEDRDV